MVIESEGIKQMRIYKFHLTEKEFKVMCELIEHGHDMLIKDNGYLDPQVKDEDKEMIEKFKAAIPYGGY